MKLGQVNKREITNIITFVPLRSYFSVDSAWDSDLAGHKVRFCQAVYFSAQSFFSFRTSQSAHLADESTFFLSLVLLAQKLGFATSDRISLDNSERFSREGCLLGSQAVSQRENRTLSQIEGNETKEFDHHVVYSIYPLKNHFQT
jgi:hypothetical protein